MSTNRDTGYQVHQLIRGGIEGGRSVGGGEGEGGIGDQGEEERGDGGGEGREGQGVGGGGGGQGGKGTEGGAGGDLQEQRRPEVEAEVAKLHLK